MQSCLTIICKNCLEEVKQTLGFGISTSTGLVRLPIVVGTSYTVNDLYPLFTENYTCPFCGKTFIFSPDLMGFVNDYIHAKYHINFEVDKIEIANDKGIITIDKSSNEDDLQSIVSKQNYDSFPNMEEMQEIIHAANNIDSKNWIFKINSGFVSTPFSHKVMPSFVKDEYE